MTKAETMVEVQMSYVGAVVAGLMATGLFIVVAKLISMSQLNLPRYLGTLYNPNGNRAVGFFLLFVLGCIFALIYAALWSAGLGRPFVYLWALVFGILQWFLVGFLVGLFPLVHAGIKAGTVSAPGFYMTNLMGGWAFPAGLVSHMIFGFSVAYIYQFFIYR